MDYLAIKTEIEKINKHILQFEIEMANQNIFLKGLDKKINNFETCISLLIGTVQKMVNSSLKKEGG